MCLVLVRGFEVIPVMQYIQAARALTLLLACLLMLAGCGSPSSAPTSLEQEETSIQASLPLGFNGSVAHLASVAGPFKPKRDGKDFSDDLSNSLVSHGDPGARFDSHWTGQDSSIDDVAHCIYRLKVPEPGEIPLEIDWQGSAPADCWIGLANWERDAWDWRWAGSTSSLVLTDSTRYAGEDDRCLVAVLVLSENEYTLESIGFPYEETSDGYTLYGPMESNSVFLIDMDGEVVHTWETHWQPGSSVELTEDGFLIRACELNNPGFPAGGTGGRIEKIDWDSNVVWSYELSNTEQCQHHDFAILPSGNIILLVWQKYTAAEAIQAGRDPNMLSGGELWADCLIEIEPTGTSGGNVVWEWYIWDHLVQGFDETKDNFGVVSEHPELIDLNYGPDQADWTHINSVRHNSALDQLVLSVHSLDELWIIDHSTDSTEAASHAGGNSGKGGDLLYRWGNPEAYGAGTASDRVFYQQHDAHWIESGLEGAGNLLIFNNGLFRPGGNYSSIIEITPPLQPDGSYLKDGNAWGPDDIVWEYAADPPADFFSMNISSSQRMPGGNTLICSGRKGFFFEVNPAGEVVWEYQNPFGFGPLMKAVFHCLRYPYDYPGLSALQE